MEDFEALFKANLSQVKSVRFIRFKQMVYSFKTFYFVPFGMSCIFAKPIADHFYSIVDQQVQWNLTAYGVILFLVPFFAKLMWKDRAFDKEKVFLVEALKRTLKDQTIT